MDFVGGDERVMEVLHGLSSIGATVVQSNQLFVPERSQMPLVRVAWRDPYQRAYGRPDHAIRVDEVDTIFSFPPRFSGVQEGEGTTLVDSAADFTAGDAPVRVGDAVRNLTSEETGFITELGATEHELVCSIAFAEDDEYDIHWAKDCIVYKMDDHEAVITIDHYADPVADYDTGVPIETLTKRVRDWIWTAGRDALQAVGVEVVDFGKMMNQSGMIGSGLPSDDYARFVAELTVAIGGSIEVRRATVETISPERSDDLLEE